ncbi:hypothetical protein [Rubripirellula tenax]|uniref:hypothetical protein n=1 Tax=Rubripirellula tenax TaxID=2528015 RepID=UPI0011B4B1C7|nr:hypothetical protein [Rubripirellula tenax]
MSLPLQSAGAIVGAAVLATKAVQQIGKSLGFDEVLAAEASANAASSPEALIKELSQAIAERLDESGFGVNLPAKLDVTFDGEIQVAPNHPQAAQIESRLANDPKISTIVEKLRSSAGPGPWSVDLTKSSTQGNILESFGG